MMMVMLCPYILFMEIKDHHLFLIGLKDDSYNYELHNLHLPYVFYYLLNLFLLGPLDHIVST